MSHTDSLLTLWKTFIFITKLISPLISFAPHHPDPWRIWVLIGLPKKHRQFHQQSLTLQPILMKTIDMSQGSLESPNSSDSNDYFVYNQ